MTSTALLSPRDDLTTARAPGLLEELRWRGMLHQHTPGLPERLARGPVSAYNGFDPTADSLHVGHLVPIFGLLHLQRHGNRPIAVVGGGTGMIGDPSFRSADRMLLTRADVERNVAAIRGQLQRFLDFDPGPTAARLIDNHDWLGQFLLIEFLRDIGKHFTIPYMLAKDSVQTRLEGGLTFTEFSYMLLQSADFLHLYRDEGVELQTGGADQWGNITAGLELIRRVEGGEEGADRVHALSFPLFMNASGTKFGKSEAGGSVWLDAARTSPFEFYQYWFDASDQDVGKLLRTFTLFDRESVERLEAEQTATPERRPAQRALAFDITARVHGIEGAQKAAGTSKANSGGRFETAAEMRVAAETFGVVPIPRDAVIALLRGDPVPLAIASTLFTSNSEARRAIAQGGFSVNGEALRPPYSVHIAPGLNEFRFGKKRIKIGDVEGPG